MNGKNSKKELADAGRRKLDAWRAKQAKGKGLSQNSQTTPEPKANGFHHTAEFPSPSIKPNLHIKTERIHPDNELGGFSVQEDSKKEQNLSEQNSLGATTRNQTLSQSQDEHKKQNQGNEKERNGLQNGTHRFKMPPPRPSFQRPPPYPQKSVPSEKIEPPKADILPKEAEPDKLGTLSPNGLSISVQDSPRNDQNRASGLKDDLEEILPSGSSAYAELSDSYLSPDTGTKGPHWQNNEEDHNSKITPEAEENNRILKPGVSEETLKPFSRENVEQQPKGSSWSFSWMRKSPQQKPRSLLADDDQFSPLLDPSTTLSEIDKKHDSETGSENLKTKGLSQSEEASTKVQEEIKEEEKKASTSNQSPAKHNRVASLNTWADDLPDFEAKSQESSQQTPLQNGLRNLEVIKEDVLDFKSTNGFHFDRLPEVDGNALKAWTPNSTGSSPRQVEAGDKIQPFLPNGKMPKSPSFAHLMREDSEAERNQFQGLQEHIDELTMEKFELKRGLEHQQSIAANLASENQKLLDDFNRQAARIHRLEQEMDRRQIQISAQQMALDGVGGERDAGRSTLQEALQRSENLAAEVVSLEEKAYKSKVNEVRATKKSEENEAIMQSAVKAKNKLASECIELKTIISNLQDEIVELQEKLRQATLNGRPESSDNANKVNEPNIELLSHTDGGVASSKATQVSEIIAKAVAYTSKEHSEVEGQFSIPDSLSILLPKRGYKGGMSGEAEEIADEQRKLAESIHILLKQLHDEKQALLVFLHSQQEECQKLKIENTRLKGGIANQSSILKSLQTGQQLQSPKQGKGSALGWLGGIVAPRPNSAQ